jgi:two-component system chemotaxis response regulator CheV
MIGADNYWTAITKLDDKIIEIIDVEKVMAEVIGEASEVTDTLVEEFARQNAQQRPHILVADDSSVARKQIVRTLDKIGIDTTVVNDGKQALDLLQSWVEEGLNINQHVSLIISDIEMPEMDGYSLTTAVKKDPALQELKILLHSSMSGEFNNSLIKQTGADKFIPKFKPDELATAVQELLNNQSE